TSFAAPVVSSVAALMMHRKYILIIWPEIIKAVLMSSAINNLTGSVRLSTQDGAGGIVAEIADNILQGNGGGLRTFRVNQTGSFNIEQKIEVRSAATIRAAVAWNADPKYIHYEDQPNIDLDLTLTGPNGKVITVPSVRSLSFDNTYEIIHFDTRGLTGTYTLKVSRFRCIGTSSGALAWWCGWTAPYN
ncbi:MAG: S8 family serine peptidase, partial [Planctomycetes bacterium]|nr:S8 family serine peptidase [Planctomycetota bacterium]